MSQNPTSDQPWTTTFRREHKRSPGVKLDGIEAWLRDEIEYLESVVSLTEYGRGVLGAHKSTLEAISNAQS